MAAITDLAAASSVAAGDNLVINQSGTDRKVTADKFVVAGNANTVTGANTYSAVQAFNGGLICSKLASGAAMSMTNTQVRPLSDWVGSNLGYGLLVVMDGSNGPVGVFVLRGAVGATEISDPASKFSVTAGTATSINVYYSGGAIQVQNNSGGTILVYLSLIGL